MATNSIRPSRFETHRPLLLAGLRRQHSNTDAANTIPLQWQEFKSGGAILGQVGSSTYGVICGGDENAFEYMCAVEVSSLDALTSAMGKMRITEQYYAVFEHNTQTATYGETWYSIMNDWLPKAGATAGYVSALKPDFEVYGDRFNKQTGEGIVEIWISLKKIDN
jgi:AraC family transcriptional regulator